MNPFRTKKKGKDATNAASLDVEASTVPLKISKTFKRGKKNKEPEQKIEIDFATVLPPTDNFRTSLLMPNLSARFSMLREQDDPTTKIGKASDDSVLFSRRGSRFQSHNGLSDIAEVESIKGPIRPPYANSREDSFDATDDEGSQNGSVMSRARPGEGNNLFGGRQ